VQPYASKNFDLLFLLWGVYPLFANLQQKSVRYNTQQHTATHSNTQQHIATHFITLQHIALLCNMFECLPSVGHELRSQWLIHTLWHRFMSHLNATNSIRRCILFPFSFECVLSIFLFLCVKVIATLFRSHAVSLSRSRAVLLVCCFTHALSLSRTLSTSWLAVWSSDSHSYCKVQSMPSMGS